MSKKYLTHLSILVISSLFFLATACKSAKPAVQNSMDELYKTWRIDSVYMEGNFVQNSELKGGTIEFTKDKQLITKTGKRENSIVFELDNNKIINTHKPADPTLDIEQLDKDLLILKSENGGFVKLRMILSPLKL